jgi:hypothetical protein
MAEAKSEVSPKSLEDAGLGRIFRRGSKRSCTRQLLILLKRTGKDRARLAGVPKKALA